MSQLPPELPLSVFGRQNLVDRVVSYFAPSTGAARMAARGAMALAGGYTGAKTDKASLSTWRPGGGSPKTDVIRDLKTLRSRSRDLERNAPVAAAVINTTAQHVIGTGLSCNPHIDGAFLGLSDEDRDAWQMETRRRFRAWSESTDCDISRHLTFYGIQDLALRSTMSSGDVFLTTPMVARQGKAERLALQMLEADLCSNPESRGYATPEGRSLTAGIEHDVGTGEALRYWFSNMHPGDESFALDAQVWTGIEARGANSGRRNVIHLFKQIRPGLKRGVPILAPVMEPLKQLARYTEAELAAAVTTSIFSVFLKMDPHAFGDLLDDQSRGDYINRAQQWSGELQAGTAVNLLPGEEPVSVNPSRPNPQFDPFVQSCIRQIGMGIGIPYEVLVMHYQSSYSAARGALLMAWRFFMGWRDWMATYLCQPVYELWLANEVAAGRISAPGFFSNDVRRWAWLGAQWVGDGPGSIDPNKEVDAAKARVALSISTLQAESVLHDGVDWETKVAQRAREIERLKEAGISIPDDPSTAPPAPPEPEVAPAPAAVTVVQRPDPPLETQPPIIATPEVVDA